MASYLYTKIPDFNIWTTDCKFDLEVVTSFINVFFNLFNFFFHKIIYLFKYDFFFFWGIFKLLGQFSEIKSNVRMQELKGLIQSWLW